ncbi:MAG: hypothetical protein IT581_13670 [Verrucomicrobiales bacterium]|nr:hypothetical protein [Verrucomicrobiales bacterium]
MRIWRAIMVGVIACTWDVMASVIRPSETEASWYGEDHRGKPMANGKPFVPEDLTCASWFYPLGTRLDVRRVGSRRCVTVTVTDRGPARRLVRRGRAIDLSAAAFHRLADLDRGLVRVSIRIIK